MQSLDQEVSDCGIVCTWTHFFYQLYELLELVHLDTCVCYITFNEEGSIPSVSSPEVIFSG